MQKETTVVCVDAVRHCRSLRYNPCPEGSRSCLLLWRLWVSADKLPEVVSRVHLREEMCTFEEDLKISSIPSPSFIVPMSSEWLSDCETSCGDYPVGIDDICGTGVSS